MTPEVRSGRHSNGEMSFWDHLDALRAVVWKSVAVWLVLAIVAFAAMPVLFQKVILAPCRGDFPMYVLLEKLSALWPGFLDADGLADFHVELINIELASQFFIQMSTSGWAAFVVALPAILYFLWGFVSPALYKNERRDSKIAFAGGYMMFCLGMTVGYFLVFPLTVRFLSGYQLSPDIPNVISINSYIDMFMGLMLVMGLLFELPLLAWILGRLGLITKRFFVEYRRHAIVALLVLAAIITPTGDPFTLFAVFLPVYAVWELASCVVPKN